MAGIYVHIPFCKKQCSYCDFHFSTTFESYRERMVNAICHEAEMRSKESKEIVETIYLGGGTPSILKAEELLLILNSIKNNYGIADFPEITLECNPDDCSEENLRSWKTLGFNRISIGIQSLDEHQLDWMNRAHNALESTKAVLLAKECGFGNITVDLIYGLPDLSPDVWKQTIRKVADLPVDHISAYCLTVEEKTPLAAWVKSGKIRPSTNDAQSEQFLILVETLMELGFEQYEISNFARKKAYSKHNTAYWMNKNYIGIGPSAHGYDGETRYWKEIESGKLPQEVEKLSNYDRFNERIMVGLRTKWGVSISELKSYLDLDDAWLSELDELITAGDLRNSNDSLVLTESGKLRADAIASTLFKLSN